MTAKYVAAMQGIAREEASLVGNLRVYKQMLRVELKRGKRSSPFREVWRWIYICSFPR